MLPPGDSWQFDERLWPVLLIRAPEQMTMRGWRVVFDAIAGYLQRPCPVKKTFVTIEGAPPGIRHAAQAAPFFLDNAELMREQLNGWGLVLPSAKVRLAVNFMLWLAPPPVPHPVFRTEGEAIAWALEFYGSGGRLRGNTGR